MQPEESTDHRNLPAPPPLSPVGAPAGARGEIHVEVEVARAAATRSVHLHLPAGTAVREVVRRSGCHPEGAAVLLDGRSVPLDLPLERSVRLIVVPTFSGG